MPSKPPFGANPQYPDSGSIFRKEAEGNRPTWGGAVHISDNLAAWIIKQHSAGEDVFLELSGWDKRSKNGNSFLALKVAKPYVKPGSAPAKKNDLEDDVPW